MKSHIGYLSFLILLAAIYLTVTSKAQSNEQSSLILPPVKWDAQTHILASLVATNQPGDYPLRPAWVGVEKITLRTGIYAADIQKTSETNRSFHFDRFTVLSRPIIPVAREDRFICEAKGDGQVLGSMFGYRPSLPTNEELLAVHDVMSVSNLLGFNPFKNNSEHSSAIGVRCFSLGPYDSIETIEVMFMNNQGESKISGILVKRGKFRSK